MPFYKVVSNYEYNFRLSAESLRSRVEYIYKEALNTDKLKFIIDNAIDNNKEYALLLLKPGRHKKIKNENLTKKNLSLIMENVFKTGWELNNVVAYDSSLVSEEILKQHYPQFWLGVGKNIAELLNEDEKKVLTDIYGTENAKNKIIHVLDIVKSGGDAEIIADLWTKHKNGKYSLKNKINVLNEGNPCPIWGKKRVLLIDKSSRRTFHGKTMAEIFQNVPEEKFFIYNGYVSHMVERFTRPGEKILIMLFARGFYSGYTPKAFRDYVVSVLRDTLARFHDSKTGNKKMFFNHEETFVHCTDPASKGIDHFWREIRAWLPDKAYQEIYQYFQPERGVDVSRDIFFEWMEKYRNGTYSARNNQRKFKFKEAYFARKEDVLKIKEKEKYILWKKGKEILTKGLVVNLLPAGGTGGRFFGYSTPEYERIKIIAEKFEYDQRQISSLEARLRFYLKEGFLVNIPIMCSDKNKDFMAKEVKKIVKRVGYPENLISFYFQVGLPRFNPTKSDVLESDKFKEEFLGKELGNKKLKNIEKERLVYQKIAENGTPGDYFRNDNGEIETKAPGSISTLTSYIINGHFRKALLGNAEFLMIANGEDLGAIVDPVKIGYLMEQKADCLAVVTESQGDRGSIVKNENGELFIAQAEQLPNSLSKAEPLLANVNNIYIKTRALLALLGVTREQFLKLNKYQILELVQEKIIKKLDPSVEIKPVPVDDNNIRFCGQFTLPDEDIVNLMKTVFVYEERDNALYQMKKENDIPEINKRIKQLLYNEVSGLFNNKKYTVIKQPTGNYELYINEELFLRIKKEDAVSLTKLGLSEKERRFVRKLIYKVRFLTAGAISKL